MTRYGAEAKTLYDIALMLKSRPPLRISLYVYYSSDVEYTELIRIGYTVVAEMMAGTILIFTPKNKPVEDVGTSIEIRDELGFFHELPIINIITIEDINNIIIPKIWELLKYIPPEMRTDENETYKLYTVSLETEIIPPDVVIRSSYFNQSGFFKDIDELQITEDGVEPIASNSYEIIQILYDLLFNTPLNKVLFTALLLKQ